VITRRTLLCRLTLGTVAAPLVVEAQSAGKAYRIGYLGNTSALAQATRVESLRAALRDLGYEEGKNIVIEFRWAEGKLDRLPATPPAGVSRTAATVSGARSQRGKPHRP
jgi:putative tryptophan/tyrosine transport system substrate-binding protein